MIKLNNTKCTPPKGMSFEIDKRTHYVIYIEYEKNVPYNVITIAFIDTADEPYWRLFHWDCFKNFGDKNDLKLYEIGSGGDETEINASKWVDGYIGLYWLADGLKLKGKVKNGIRLANPKRAKDYMLKKTSINPFKIAEITHSYDYCDRCKLAGDDLCLKHIYEDDENVLRYKDNDEKYY